MTSMEKVTPVTRNWWYGSVSGSRNWSITSGSGSRNWCLMSVSGQKNSGSRNCYYGSVSGPRNWQKTSVSGSRNWRFLSVSFLDPETDIMDQFLGPETDIMGEGNFMILSCPVLSPLRALDKGSSKHRALGWRRLLDRKIVINFKELSPIVARLIVKILPRYDLS